MFYGARRRRFLRRRAWATASLVCCFCVSCPVYSQTSIVAIKTPTQVVLGADSKVKYFTPDGPGPDARECKIVQEGSVFFGVAFVASNTKTGFDAEDIAARAIRRARTIEEIVTEFQTMVTGPLRRALKALPQYYWRDEVKDKAQFQIVFAAMERGFPVLCGIDIRAAGDSFNLIPQTIGLCRPIERTNGPSGVLSFGLHNAIDAYLPTHQGSILRDPAAGVRTLIQLEVDEDKDHVGPPINILRLNKQGAKWLNNEENCPKKK